MLSMQVPHIDISVLNVQCQF